MDIHEALGADRDEDEGSDLFPSTSGKDAAGGGGGGSRKMKKASAKAEEMIKKELGQAPAKKSTAKVGKDKGDEDDDDGEEDGAVVPSGPRVLGVSKKDPALRRKELLSAGGMSSLATALTALVAERAGPLLRSAHGASVVVEVSRGGDGGEPGRVV